MSILQLLQIFECLKCSNYYTQKTAALVPRKINLHPNISEIQTPTIT
ncbi:hypothetical protein MACK_003601 [Theileria orientalis]|uniref:Uncharacterized protein n=1 Tax=Theileria orientalis TaxID=68886 RepID=A0A976XJK2_THEOR|nr:hypothetical protein MACK_003601 [Theileria orientalis]